MDFFNYLSSLSEFFFGSYPFLFVAYSISFTLKVFLLVNVIRRYSSASKTSQSKILLTLVLVGAVVEDIAWIALLLKQYLKQYFGYTFLKYIVPSILRISWIFYVIFYQSLTLFIENLVDPTVTFRLKNIFFISCSCVLGTAFIYNLILGIGNFSPSHFQLILESLCTLYMLFLLVPISLWYSAKLLKLQKKPKILQQQYKILLKILVIPRLIADFIQYYPFQAAPNYFTNSYAILGISSLSLTIALFYCARRVIGLRFLNFSNHVQSPQSFNFIDDFKEVLEKLGHVTSVREIGHITQTYCKEAFSIPLMKTTLYVRHQDIFLPTQHYKPELNRLETTIENFLTMANPDALQYLHTHRILIYDELDFTHFYENDERIALLVTFLDTINADIFLPIYKNQTIIAYLIVERYARPGQFYSNVERDEMLVFASYLANIINLLQNRSLESVLLQEKEIREELFQKHQEIAHYKESMRSFIKQPHKDIGIIFYKHRRFSFANQVAQEIIGFNLNTHEGHPLTKAVKRIAQLVEEYKAPQKLIIKHDNGNKLSVNAVPALETNSVIITISYPDCTDVITNQLDQLRDPTKWDYLLYLETTKPGQLINQLIPSTGEILLNFKIQLLELALSKKALLLEMAVEDVMPTVELIHHISMRETLHILTLENPVKSTDILIKLFGISAVFGLATTEKPLFEKLNETGTLFIEHIENLDRETQEYLAEYIKYGYFRAYKSDTRIVSSVRVICSTQKNLVTLIQEGSFSANLYTELKKAVLSMPSLLTLPENEFSELAHAYSHQALQQEQYPSLLDLTKRDATKLAIKRPTSLHTLKHRVQHLLAQKTKHNPINHELHIDPAYDVTDPELKQAARLGKHALRDQRTMTLLWDKFKNQNKIATFLGVNRSSVNRRCKEFNLQ